MRVAERQCWSLYRKGEVETLEALFAWRDPEKGMGGGQSKGGGLRRQVRPLVPRAWAEVEQLRVRFQQEARRRRSDPEAQHFLVFSAFHAIAAPLCPSAGKIEFLAMFQALDRKRRGRIAAIDLFSGLALVVDAKKAQKLDCAALKRLVDESRDGVDLPPNCAVVISRQSS